MTPVILSPSLPAHSTPVYPNFILISTTTPHHLTAHIPPPNPTTHTLNYATTGHLHIFPEDDNIAIPTINALAQQSTVTFPPDSFFLYRNPFGTIPCITIPTKVIHSTLDLDLHTDNDTRCMLLYVCLPSTPAIRIPWCRSTLRQSYIIAIRDDPVEFIDNVIATTTQACASNAKSQPITMVRPEHNDIKDDSHIS